MCVHYCPQGSWYPFVCLAVCEFINRLIVKRDKAYRKMRSVVSFERQFPSGIAFEKSLISFLGSSSYYVESIFKA